MRRNLRHRELEKEIRFNTSRSGGPGGQHANKVETSVELRFDISNSPSLNRPEKRRLLKKLGNKITKEGELIITAENSRSQAQNKEEALEKFFTMMENALKVPKKRKPTQPSKAAKEKRLKEKKKHGEKKSYRKPPDV